MARGIALADLHPSVEAGVNNQDLDGLMALYAPDATMVLPDGSTVTGASGPVELVAFDGLSTEAPNAPIGR